MFTQSPFSNINSYLIVLLALIAIIGDYLVIHSKLHVFQAIFDNATHAIIGGISWLIVFVNCKSHSSVQTLIEIGFCTLAASLIDLDHFIAAKSLNLKDATSLSHRPFLHCSTFPLIFCFIVLSLSYILQVSWLKKGALILLTAFLSHHTRDATRRGYWLYPYGSTPAIPYGVYVILTCLIPYFICFLNGVVKINQYYGSHNRTVIL